MRPALCTMVRVISAPFVHLLVPAILYCTPKLGMCPLILAVLDRDYHRGTIVPSKDC